MASSSSSAPDLTVADEDVLECGVCFLPLKPPIFQVHTPPPSIPSFSRYTSFHMSLSVHTVRPGPCVVLAMLRQAQGRRQVPPVRRRHARRLPTVPRHGARGGLGPHPVPARALRLRGQAPVPRAPGPRPGVVRARAVPLPCRRRCRRAGGVRLQGLHTCAPRPRRRRARLALHDGALRRAVLLRPSPRRVQLLRVPLPQRRRAWQEVPLPVQRRPPWLLPCRVGDPCLPSRPRGEESEARALILIPKEARRDERNPCQ